MTRAADDHVDPVTTKAVRRPYHHGHLRHALIAAGLGILEEGGLEALTLRAIAARAGVSHTAPRNHFPSLRALHTAIAAEGFRRHARAMRQDLSEGSSREERLRAAVRGYVGFAAREPALFALMFSWRHTDHEDPDLRTAGGESYGVLREVSEGLAWPGAEGPDRKTRTEAMLWSFVHGYAALAQAGLLERATGRPFERGAEADAVLSVMPAFGYEEGQLFKALPAHTREQHRARWGLLRDHPMVAPAYARKRQERAIKIGLGRKPAEPVEEKPAPKPRSERKAA